MAYDQPISHTCEACQKEYFRRLRRPGNCGDCQYRFNRRWSDRSGCSAALAAVKKAIKQGRLPSPKGLPCKDCERPADRYDHRDYNKPLQVDPVCASCNNLRGPAKLLR